MSNRIQLLPDHVANQIAAGEVVQRPSSVVKELIENAIDADADHIKLIIKEAGKVLIQVVDNGIGMNVTDARLCFERHATSKIQKAEDLFTLCTKGFRGEAMASIAAIAHVSLKTRSDADEVGTELILEGSSVLSQEACVTPKGTSISVKNLFYNIPARRNFLKSNSVELRHIIDEFHRVAISHPHIRFDMFHNGGDVFNLPISNYRQRIVNIFGGKMNEKLVPIQEDTDLVRISGFIGKPEFAKRTRGEQYFFVNNRFIKSPYLHHGITSAFDGLLKDKTHPTYFVFLEVDPGSIDINIHPTKTEIKFEDEHSVYAILRATIKHSLGQFSVAPVLDFNRDQMTDIPYAYKDKAAVQPDISVDRSFNPFQSDHPSTSKHSERKGNYSYSKPVTLQPKWESLYSGLHDSASQNRGENQPTLADSLGSESFTSAGFSTEFKSGAFEQEKEGNNLLHIESKGQEENTGTAIHQLQRKYIVTTVRNGLLLIHQHRAHYRILYEELLRTISTASGVSQQLLFPIEVSISSKEFALFEECKEHLELTGFVFESMNQSKLCISGVPAILPNSEEVTSLFQKIFSDLEYEVPDSGFSRTDTLARSMAEAMAVKSGALLKEEQLQNIVNRLFACTEPSVAPNNKATLYTWSVSEIDRKF